MYIYTYIYIYKWQACQALVPKMTMMMMRTMMERFDVYFNWRYSMGMCN